MRVSVYFILVIVLAVSDPFIVQAVRLLAFDGYQRLSPRDYDPSLPIRIVDIDDHSLEVVGQWPWSRTTIAELTDKLREAGAAVVVFDIMFAEPDRISFEQIAQDLPDEARTDLTERLQDWPTNDARFAAAIARMKTVLGLTLNGSGPRTSIPRRRASPSPATIPSRSSTAIRASSTICPRSTRRPRAWAPPIGFPRATTWCGAYR